MASYLRSLFGSHESSSSSSTQSHGSRPRRSSSHSTSYSGTPTSSSRSGAPSFKRSNSYTAARSTTPSPLSGVVYESARPQAPRRRSSSKSQSKNATFYPTPKYNTTDLRPQYHIRSPSAPYIVTPTSSRTGSSASLHPGTPGLTFMQPLSRSTSHSSKSKPTRPALKQNHTWQTNGTASSTGHASSHARSHVTFHSPTSLHMHPLFAYSRVHHAPIAYDVIHAPSARTVLDCTTHSPVPAHTLSQPATDPPTAAPSQLVLRSHKFPWTIVVNSSGLTSGNSGSASSKKMSRSHSRSSSMQASVITNLDVLYAVHTTLLSRVTPEEWEALGNGSKAQRKVTKAYEKRCTSMGGWEGGVRRVDWLGGKTHLSGIEVDKTGGNGIGKLIFSKP